MKNKFLARRFKVGLFFKNFFYALRFMSDIRDMPSNLSKLFFFLHIFTSQKEIISIAKKKKG